MAVVALVAGNDVTGRFAGRNDIVMARITTTSHRRMIHERHRAPRVRRVTIAADLRALHVLRTLSGCLDRPDCRVTADAIGARGFELAARMTAFTRDVDVRTVKVEARAEMIERFLRIHRRGADCQEDQARKVQ